MRNQSVDDPVRRMAIPPFGHRMLKGPAQGADRRQDILRIGYEPVCDAVDYRFERPPG